MPLMFAGIYVLVAPLTDIPQASLAGEAEHVGCRVDYHSRMGVEVFHMHVPVGDHIDALFDGVAREERIRETTSLNERSPETVGVERFSKFDHPKVRWQEYYGAPTANYYSGEPALAEQHYAEPFHSASRFAHHLWHNKPCQQNKGGCAADLSEAAGTKCSQ